MCEKLEKLRQNFNEIDLSIKKLNQSLFFIINKYDYHHKEDENDILKNQCQILGEMKDAYTSYESHCKEVTSILNEAKRKAELFDKMLEQIVKQYNLPPSVIVRSFKDSECNSCSSDEDKENQCSSD